MDFTIQHPTLPNHIEVKGAATNPGLTKFEYENLMNDPQFAVARVVGEMVTLYTKEDLRSVEYMYCCFFSKKSKPVFTPETVKIPSHNLFLRKCELCGKPVKLFSHVQLCDEHKVDYLRMKNREAQRRWRERQS